MAVSIVLVAILPALLVAAAVWDLTSFTIPNIIPLAMIVLFAGFVLTVAMSSHAMGWGTAGLHILAGVVGLVAGMGFFAAGWVGGGDAKLFAVASLWLGWNAMFQYTVLASLLGGVLTLSLIVLRRLPLPSILAAQPWISRLADNASDVPYGVALAIAALVVLPDTELFRLAVAG